MDERRLRYFLTVVEEGSVTRASTRLRVAQPSLSQTLRALEQELGVELFHRVGRGLRVAPAGEAFIGPARQALRAMDEGRDAIAGVLELRSGMLEIAALATLAVDPMATLVGRFRALYPGVQVRMIEPETADGVRALVRDGRCELGAAHLASSRPGLEIQTLGEQELLFAMPPQGPDDPERPLHRRELARTPLVVSPPGTSTRILLEQALAAVGVMPQIAVETAAREAIIPLVLAGAGAALLPAPIAREAQRRGARVRPARPSITRPIGLVHRGALSAAARRFLELAAARPDAGAAPTRGAAPARRG
ncbi:MAG TPA: LysR substrate-binding domain-containing protein [Solirubrobacteraceae bacterium]|nr:LysR substrate-binding domain-containing protein [Solirubrobacteraceae bacterium]